MFDHVVVGGDHEGGVLQKQEQPDRLKRRDRRLGLAEIE